MLRACASAVSALLSVLRTSCRAAVLAPGAGRPTAIQSNSIKLLASCWFVRSRRIRSMFPVHGISRTVRVATPSAYSGSATMYRFVLLKFSPADTQRISPAETGLPVLRKRSMMKRYAAPSTASPPGEVMYGSVALSAGRNQPSCDTPGTPALPVQPSVV